jgi:preprotein translocase SecE subunit
MRRKVYPQAYSCSHDSIKHLKEAEIDDFKVIGYTCLDSLQQQTYFISEEIVADKTKVTRIKATDEKPKTAKVEKAKGVKPEAVSVEAKKNVFARIGGYFKGSWVELRQVRWPNRRATWGLTLAVLIFSAFFVVLILLLDTLFKYVFQLIIT